MVHVTGDVRVRSRPRRLWTFPNPDWKVTFLKYDLEADLSELSLGRGKKYQLLSYLSIAAILFFVCLFVCLLFFSSETLNRAQINRKPLGNDG